MLRRETEAELEALLVDHDSEDEDNDEQESPAWGQNLRQEAEALLAS